MHCHEAWPLWMLHILKMKCSKCKKDIPRTITKIVKDNLVTKCLDCWNKEKPKRRSPAFVGDQGGGSYKSKI